MHATLHALLALLLLPGVPGRGAEGYRLPPEPIVRMVDAPPSPRVSLDPLARWMLLVERPSLPPIADLARPWIGLAGLRLDPASGSRWRASYDAGLVLREVEGETRRRVSLPAGARIADVAWSPRGDRVAVSLVRDGGTEVWVAAVDEGVARLAVDRLNGLFGPGFVWMPDGEALLCLRIPEDRGPAPRRPEAPRGPAAQDTAGVVSPVPTWPDLLRNDHDDRLFEHHARAQVVLWRPGDSQARPLGEPATIVAAEPSPDGEHMLVTRLRAPWPRSLPHGRFARTLEVWGLDGATEHVVAELPAAEEIPLGGVPGGARRVGWHPVLPATLLWVVALDGGDPGAEVDFRDRWMLHAAPFAGRPRAWQDVEHRAAGLEWMPDPGMVFVEEVDGERRWTRTTLVHLDDPEFEPVVVDDRSLRDLYSDPGRLATRVTPVGTRVVQRSGDLVYRIGRGASPGGERPFLARQNLVTLESERLWRSAPGSYETVIGIVRGGTERLPSVVTRYESPEEPPNYRLRDLQENTRVALTDFEHPIPALRGIEKRLVTYSREDGVELTGTLYLPAGHEPGARLPLLIWARPLEVGDGATTGQVSGSPYTFTRPRGASHLYLVTQGYAVLDRAAMPVLGDPQTVRDTFVEQVVASARAAVEEMDRLGVGDPQRAAVGGHGPGATLVATLLANSDLFRAGVARSGVYNRTLTPFDLRVERRTLWEAPEVYSALSPFLRADEIDEPLLLIHGAVDEDPDAFPMQSARLFHALRGTGGTARLVELPAEGHVYRARESVLHALAETLHWLDRHVKLAEPVSAGFSRDR